MSRQKFIIGLVTGLSIFITGVILYISDPFKVNIRQSEPLATPVPSPDMLPIGSPVPSPSPATKTLSREEREKLYGPCVFLPVLMYHHVDTAENAKAGSYASLNVTPEFFASQMEFLKTNNYHPVSPAALSEFFDSGIPMPSKPVIITFDDAYSDLAVGAFPILNGFGFPAVVFVPTGLVNNSGYLSWSEITSVPRDIYFGNHTWSHQSAKASDEKLRYEIATADTQLADRGENPDKIFAYPYGGSSTSEIGILKSLGYKLAFTTLPGSWQCKANRYVLTRTRIGNASLKSYGL